MLQVQDDLAIDDRWLSVRFSRAGGPGGQHVNKVATKVELRLHLEACTDLGEDVKRRLRQRHPAHVTTEGDFVVTAGDRRTQGQNRHAAEARLAQMIRSALKPPKPRVPTRVPARTKRKRLRDKRHRAEVKRKRKPEKPDE